MIIYMPSKIHETLPHSLKIREYQWEEKERKVGCYKQEEKITTKE